MSRRILLVVLTLTLLGACGGEEGPEPATLRNAKMTWTFDGAPPGAPPPGFTVLAGEWAVETTAGGSSLAQTASGARADFNLALLDAPGFADVDLTVRVRANEGEIDQGGGLVWRARDGKNYYVARWNPLEENYRVYTVVDGKRTQLMSAKATAEPGWHKLRVIMRGEAIECFLDGEAKLAIRDTTFPEAGRIGLWTKADARTSFDDLAVAGP